MFRILKNKQHLIQQAHLCANVEKETEELMIRIQGAGNRHLIVPVLRLILFMFLGEACGSHVSEAASPVYVPSSNVQSPQEQTASHRTEPPLRQRRKEIEDLIIQIQGACKNGNRHLIVPVVHLILFMSLLKRLPLMSTKLTGQGLMTTAQNQTTKAFQFPWYKGRAVSTNLMYGVGRMTHWRLKQSGTPYVA